MDRSSEIEDEGEKDDDETYENVKMEDSSEPLRQLVRIKPDPDQHHEVDIQSDPLDVRAIKTEMMEER